MQFIVFAAFAVALSIPQAGPPWTTITSPPWTWGIVIGQIVLPAAVAGVWSRLVRRKLEREPAWLPAAQRRLAQGNVAIRTVLVGGLATSAYLTDWAVRVRRWDFARALWGLDEMVILAPFFAAVVLSWIALYPADRAVRRVALELRLWASAPARPVWRLFQYLNFMLRHHVLVIAVPMVPIVVAYDFTSIYRAPLRKATGVPWANEAVFVIIAGVIFLFAPVILRFVWHTRALPPGELRDRLEALCRTIGLTYHRILVWESDGMVVNAAVMGLLRPVRYILLSDGLLEMMDDRKIEAVFGHEAGHVKLRHIEYYLVFAVLSMLLVGGLSELAIRVIRDRPEWFTHVKQAHDSLQVLAMALVILVWAAGFGVVSRRFEWQADLFGAQSVTPSQDACHHPCFLHGTAVAPPPGPDEAGYPLCASAATLFADALHRIAVLNGIPIEARSWRHSSIARRIHLLKRYGRDPAAGARLFRAVGIIKAILLVGTAVGLVIAVWLYWPWSPPRDPPAKRIQPPRRRLVEPVSAAFGAAGQARAGGSLPLWTGCFHQNCQSPLRIT